MNKKFSTLVAALLVAGAWTTLDAKVVKIATPQAGGSYMIGATVTEGDDATGQLTDLLDPTNGQMTTGASGAIKDFSKLWKFESTGKAGEFFLTNGTSYLSAATGGGKVVTWVANSNDAVKFKLVGNKIVATDAKGANASNSIWDGDLELMLQDGNIVTLETTGTGSPLEFAIYSKDKITLSAGLDNQVSPSQTSIVDGEYYFISGDGGTKMLQETAGVISTSSASADITSAKVEEFLWKVTSSTGTDGKLRYKFINKASGQEAAISGVREFIADTKYNGVVRLATGTAAGQFVTEAFAVGGAAAPFTLYKSAITALDGSVLNQLLNGGFNLSIKLAKDSKAEVLDADAFAGKLTAVKPGSFAALNAPTTKFSIKSGKNILVLNTKKGATSETGVSGMFELVTEAEAAKADYLSVFQLGNYSGTSSNDVATLKVAKADDMVGARTAYIITVDGKNYLRTKETLTGAEKLPYISLSASEIASYKDFLGKFMNISFISDDSEDAKDIVYKKNGVLATAHYGAAVAADYVDKSTVLLSSPETQWVISEVTDLNNNKFTLINRESGETVTGVSFRKTSVANEYIVETASLTTFMSDRVKIAFVEKTTKFDGFKTATVNELRNQVFNIGQYHNETGNTAGYWAENHQTNGTHQLGVIADVDAATVWALRLDNKLKDAEKLAEVDTVFIYTPMATIQGDKLVQGAAGAENVVCDTLAILPYQIQNKGNLEYVRFATGSNLDYYVCNEVADKRVEERFALKMKPNGTYNVVTLPNRQDDQRANALGDKKVYVGNSNQWGSLKQLETYKADDNSLMVVTPIDKPEYRKVKKEWGDIVKIYREEKTNEALYERFDAKSVVDKDTLSFLNVNNSVAGANPALFVDTAYVNRVDADGIVNTCYQYLLAVNVDKNNSYYCPYNPLHNTQEWRDEHNGGKPCADAMENAAVKGRFLINLIDTANVYGVSHLHDNPYVNGVEAGEKRAKLSFVEGIHANDTLYLTRKGGEVVKLAMDSSDFNVAKFAFRYVDNNAGSFKIQTQWKSYVPSTDKDQIATSQEGYLKWINGTVVVEKDFINGETFNMEENYDGQAVANEDITTSSISVIAKEGGVIINGAAGKKVVITNVLGQTIANAVLSSDNVTIAAPAGVVVVAVEGEAAVKAIVK